MLCNLLLLLNTNLMVYYSFEHFRTSRFTPRFHFFPDDSNLAAYQNKGRKGKSLVMVTDRLFLLHLFKNLLSFYLDAIVVRY